MTKKAAAGDPYERIGVFIPTSPGEDAMGEMAQCIAEEFALMGMSDEQILAIFKNPFYSGPNAIYKARGEEFVKTAISRLHNKESGQDA